MKKIAISLVTMWNSYTLNSLRTLLESDIKDKTKYDCTLFIYVNKSIDGKTSKVREDDVWDSGGRVATGVG